MKLCRLLNRVAVIEIIGNAEREILELAHNTKNIKSEALFFCIDGQNEDGHNYINEAIARGAVAAVVSRRLSINIPQVVVKNTRRAMSVIAQNFYDNPAEKMKIIAVTGTNGKTSTCLIIKSILDKAGKQSGIIGTNGIWVKNERYDCDLTTPDPIILNETLDKMYREGVTYVAFEASAHAIKLNKLDGIVADIAIFTNLSQDHLDFFKTMENYADTKRSFFTKKFARTAVVNADDSLGLNLALEPSLPTISYGVSNPCDVFAVDYFEMDKKSFYLLNLNDNLLHIETALTGLYNVYNAMAAATACWVLGIKISAIAQGINSIKEIEGRCNRIDINGIEIIVDFAHTPDGMSNILSYLKDKGRIITVFGCGGNRDRDKRSKMGSVASDYSKFIFLTEDNSRNEKVEDIISEIEKGVTIPHTIIYDRKKAIIEALNYAKSGDIIAILGKGAEKYIIKNDKLILHNDMEFLIKLKNEGNYK
ncbi:MAG: UDP-N-acetylmuramoyl-L-alanyl-D-glutamate--2,6-diaminopimelate ligase [Clostridia bacterium]